MPNRRTEMEQKVYSIVDTAFKTQTDWFNKQTQKRISETIQKILDKERDSIIYAALGFKSGSFGDWAINKEHPMWGKLEGDIKEVAITMYKTITLSKEQVIQIQNTMRKVLFKEIQDAVDYRIQELAQDAISDIFGKTVQKLGIIEKIQEYTSKRLQIMGLFPNIKEPK